MEPTPEAHIETIVEVFREVRRVLRSDGTCWINYGDSYWNGGGEKRDGGHGFVDGGKRKLEAAKGSLLQPKVKTALALKPKDLIGIPWMVAFALRNDGWWLRSDIVWAKDNPMPESVTDRPTRAHEYIFLLTKNARYFYDADAIREPHVYPALNKAAKYGEQYRAKVNGGTSKQDTVGKRTYEGFNARCPASVKKQYDSSQGGGGTGFNGHKGVYKADGTPLNNPLGRNKRDVWNVSTHAWAEAHFATFPPELITPCIKAGCPIGGTVLDPFSGSGTTGVVAVNLGREYLGIELNPEYVAMSQKRIIQEASIGNTVEAIQQAHTEAQLPLDAPKEA